MPRYIVVKPEYLPATTRTFEAWVSLNGCRPFKRNIRPWGKGSDVFFFNLTQPQCQGAGLDTGDQCTINIAPVVERRG